MPAELNDCISQKVKRHQGSWPRVSDQFFGVGMDDTAARPKRSDEDVVALFYKFLELRDEKSFSRSEGKPNRYVNNFHFLRPIEIMQTSSASMASLIGWKVFVLAR